MFIWKYLNVPNYSTIQTEIKRYVDTLPSSTNLLTFLNPEEFFYNCHLMKDWFSSIGKLKHSITIIKLSLPPAYEHCPHVDNSDYLNIYEEPNYETKFCLGLNFPIENCNNTYTVFYKFSDDVFHLKEVVHQPNGRGSHRRLDAKNLVEIDRYELTKPILINTSVPHNVINTDHSIRTALTIRLNPDPWELIK